MLYWKYLQWDQCSSQKMTRCNDRKKDNILALRGGSVREESEVREVVSVAFLSWQKEVKTVLILFGEGESKVK